MTWPDSIYGFCARAAPGADRCNWFLGGRIPSLPHLLEGLTLRTLLIRGDEDEVVPESCIKAYGAVLANAQLAEIEGVRHRPEIEMRLNSCD